ncbi:MAG: hypothetical protein JW923_08315 [Spirochaetales bacterium]|nr:hypothetical protein [Spirochaetales bacterium]
MGTDALRRWKDALIADPDDHLITAAKRWLGPVRTPFNKHELAARLESYVRKPDVAAAACALLDACDRAAVALLGKSGDLPLSLFEATLSEAFFGGDDSQAAARVRNLLSRMVIFRYRAGAAGYRVGLCPPLATAMAKEVGDADLAPSALAAKPPLAPDPLAGFCAIASACGQTKPAFRSRNALSKAAAERIMKTAPWLMDDRGRGLWLYLGALERAGALLSDGASRPELDLRSFLDLATSLGPSFVAYLASNGIRLPADLRAADLFAAAASALPDGIAVNRGDWFLVTASVLYAGFGAELCSARAADVVSAIRDTMTALLDFGVCAELPNGRVVATDSRAALGRPEPDKPAVVIEESHEIRLLPEAGTLARATVAALARLDSADLVWTATLDKAAVLADYAWGYSAGDLGSRLEGLSGRPLPQGLKFSLESWERAGKAVRLRSGIVVVLDAEHASLLERLPSALSLVDEKLADGVYLVKQASLKDAEKALLNIGVHVDVRGVGRRTLPAMPAAAPGDAVLRQMGPLELVPGRAGAEDGRRELVRGLLARLEDMDLDEAAKAAARDRVKAGLVLDPAGLEAAGRDVATASGLDYPGKVRLIERAIQEGAALELKCAERNREYREFGLPQSLDNRPDGLYVVMRAGRETVCVPVKHIAKARLVEYYSDGEHYGNG